MRLRTKHSIRSASLITAALLGTAMGSFKAGHYLGRNYEHALSVDNELYTKAQEPGPVVMNYIVIQKPDKTGINKTESAGIRFFLNGSRQSDIIVLLDMRNIGSPYERNFSKNPLSSDLFEHFSRFGTLQEGTENYFPARVYLTEKGRGLLKDNEEIRKHISRYVSPLLPRIITEENSTLEERVQNGAFGKILEGIPQESHTFSKGGFIKTGKSF